MVTGTLTLPPSNHSTGRLCTVRDRLVQRRTALINEIRGFLLERGIVFATQPIHLRKNLPAVIEDAKQNLSPACAGYWLECGKSGNKLRPTSRRSPTRLNA